MGLRGNQGSLPSDGAIKWSLQSVLWSAGGTWEQLGRTSMRGTTTANAGIKNQTTSQGTLKNG
tara:strand:- start:138 stop:326 length:189 start_codon:yes stop_codon:yes gene_type:complete